MSYWISNGRSQRWSHLFSLPKTTLTMRCNRTSSHFSIDSIHHRQFIDRRLVASFSTSQRLKDKVYCFGANQFYQCHYGDESTISSPKEVSQLEEITKISSGWTCNFIQLNNEKVLSWGTNEYGQLALPSQQVAKFPTHNRILDTVHVNKIAPGRIHTLMLSKYGQLLTFGSNEFGQLGVGLDENGCRPWPQLVQTYVQSNRIIDIASGLDHSLSLDQNRVVCSWGFGQSGQLGHGELANLNHPQPILGLPRTQKISCGIDHNLVIDEHGRLWGWGSSECGQLNTLESEILLKPERIGPSDLEFSNVACGSKYSLALSNNPSGQLWACGTGSGVLDARESEMSPMRFGPISWFTENNIAITSIASGFGHILALSSHGDLYAWGFNSDGQLGLGDFEERFEPTLVTFFTGKMIKLFSCGVNHSVVVTTEP